MIKLMTACNPGRFRRLRPHLNVNLYLPTPSFPHLLKVPAYVISRLHLLLDSDRDRARERARCLAFLTALLKMVTGRPRLRVRGHWQAQAVGEGSLAGPG